METVVVFSEAVIAEVDFGFIEISSSAVALISLEGFSVDFVVSSS